MPIARFGWNRNALVHIKNTPKHKMNYLEKLYSEIEQREELDFLPMDIIPKVEELSNEEFFAFSIECNVHCVLNKERINSVFGEKKEEVVNYINTRLTSTSNPLLIARYNHFLWMLVPNNQYCEKAIDHYHMALENIFQKKDESKIIAVENILEIVLRLSINIKYKLPELRTQTLKIIYSSTVPNRLKTIVIQTISNEKLLKREDLLNLPQICIDIAKSEIEYNWIEKNLNLSLQFLNKLPELKHLKLEVFEMLGDNELSRIKEYDGKPESIVIPHQNNRIYKITMLYYKQAKCIEKLKNTTKEYEANKKNLKYLRFSNTVKKSDEITEHINSLLNTIVNGSDISVILDLCLGKRLLSISNDIIEKAAKEDIEKYYHLKWFIPVQSDINVNQRKEDVFNHQKFCYYHNHINHNQMKFFYDVIEGAIINKKLSYAKLSKFLRKFTFLGINLPCERGNDVELTFNWFDQIDFALKSFFQQFTRYMAKKETDWRIVIDILSLRFEGMLRDIISLSGGVTTGIDSEGNTAEISLEKLIYSPTFSEIFDEDDKNLFLYTFTKAWHNIRNNVAHSFYKKQDYDIGKAILVFLSVLRLTKFSLNEIWSSNTKKFSQ